MGALLSLPLLAVPSIGTVRFPNLPRNISTWAGLNRDAFDVDHILRRQLLWSGHLLHGMQCLRQMRE
jgi:hypothetical protein